MRPARLAILFGLALAVASGGAAAETLTEALTKAYTENTDLIAARARLRATDEQVPQALAGWRPTVNVTGSAGRQNYQIGTGSLLPTSFSYRQWSYGGALKLDWSIYQGGRRQADLERAEETVRAERANLLGTEQDVLLKAATTYQDVLRSRVLLKIDRELEARLERRVRETTIRMQAGQLTLTDVHQAENKLAAARATRIGAQGNVIAAAARYVAAVGHSPAAVLLPARPPPGLPASAVQAVSLAEANNPTVLASLHRSAASGHAIAVARAGLLPTLDLSAEAQINQGETFPTVSAQGYTATLNLTVPLYQSGEAASRLRQAEAQASESKVQILTSRRDARKNAKTSYAEWRAAVEREAEQRKQVQLAQVAYEDVRKEAALGAKSTFELLGQLQEYYNARAAEVNAKYETAVRAYQLLVAIGRFTAADLHLPVAIYDPIKNYRQVREKGGTLLPETIALDPKN